MLRFIADQLQRVPSASPAARELALEVGAVRPERAPACLHACISPGAGHLPLLARRFLGLARDLALLKLYAAMPRVPGCAACLISFVPCPMPARATHNVSATHNAWFLGQTGRFCCNLTAV